MRLLPNLHVKGKPAVLPDREIRRQSHYFIFRPRIVATRKVIDIDLCYILKRNSRYNSIKTLLYFLINLTSLTSEFPDSITTEIFAIFFKLLTISLNKLKPPDSVRRRWFTLFNSSLFYQDLSIMNFKLNLAAVATKCCLLLSDNPYPTAFPYGNAMVLHFYQQQESSTTRTVHKVINRGLKTYV